MKTELKLRLLAAAMEYRWRRVLKYRREGNRRIERGESLSSDALLRLSRRIDGHSCALARMQQSYDRLSA